MTNKHIKLIMIVILLFAGVVSPLLVTANTPSNQGGDQEEKIYKMYLTGYSWYDNTPPGSSAISHPIVHQTAGGTGTYEDPITVAVGHQYIGGIDTLEFEAGTKMYIPSLRKYLIVEDTCGDGPNPESSGCLVGKTIDGETYRWIDVWVDGEGFSADVSDQCMYDLTGVTNVIVNPHNNYLVTPGGLTQSGCSIYDETPMLHESSESTTQTSTQTTTETTSETMVSETHVTTLVTTGAGTEDLAETTPITTERLVSENTSQFVLEEPVESLTTTEVPISATENPTAFAPNFNFMIMVGMRSNRSTRLPVIPSDFYVYLTPRYPGSRLMISDSLEQLSDTINSWPILPGDIKVEIAVKNHNSQPSHYGYTTYTDSFEQEAEPPIQPVAQQIINQETVTSHTTASSDFAHIEQVLEQDQGIVDESLDYNLILDQSELGSDQEGLAPVLPQDIHVDPLPLLPTIEPSADPVEDELNISVLGQPQGLLTKELLILAKLFNLRLDVLAFIWG